MTRRLLLAWLLFLTLQVASSTHAAECIRGPYLQNAAVGSIEIRWELDCIGHSSLEYATGTERARRVDCPFRGRKHRVRLTDLRPGAMYRYRILSQSEPVTEEFAFRASPAPVGADGQPPRFTFAVFGDLGSGKPEQLQVAKLLERTPAEFVLMPGDIIYSRGEEEHYDLRFFEPYRPSLRRMTFWPALGNHDVGSKDGAAALAVFDVPLNGPPGLQGGRNYSFDYGSAHVAAIDSNASEETLRSAIGPWLERDMGARKQPWKFVFFHHPPFSSAAHGETPKMRDIMVPVFTRTHVDIVFAGHDHAYERTRPRDGVTYIVSGNGGNSLYGHLHPHSYTAAFYNQKPGLTLVTIDGTHLLLRHLNVEDKEIDRLDLEKAPAGEGSVRGAVP